MAACRILMFLTGLVFATGPALSAELQVIPEAYRQIALAERVPVESLYSLAMSESRRQTAGGSKPWPGR